MTDHNELAARIERAEGPDLAALEIEVIEWAFSNRIHIASYGGPINYDPKLWADRHGFAPLHSIDAAMQLVPKGAWLEISGPHLHGSWKALVDVFATNNSKAGWGATAAIALSAAAIRARSAS